MTGDRRSPARDLEPFGAEDEATELVCYCMKVRAGTLRRAIASGAVTLGALAERTRAGTGCGTCRSELLKLLREAPRPAE